MKCPYCGNEKHGVTDTRGKDCPTEIMRIRVCHRCHRAFTTTEIVDREHQVNDRCFTQSP